MPVDSLPEVSAFVVGEGVEQGLPECDVGVYVEGFFVPVVGGFVVVIWWGVGSSFGAVVVAVMMAAGVSRVLRCG